MRFTLASGKTVDVPESKIREIVTTTMTPNPFWRYSRLLTEGEVMSFLQGSSDPKLLKRVAYYILVYAENITLSGYLYGLAEDSPSGAETYLGHMKPLLELLRSLNSLASREPSRDLVKAMIEECLREGIDPF